MKLLSSWLAFLFLSIFLQLEISYAADYKERSYFLTKESSRKLFMLENDKDEAVKIVWKGPESIIPLIENGPNYDIIEVKMDFDEDYMTNEFFKLLLDLRPKKLTIINNSKGVMEGFDPEMIVAHINFIYLEEINFICCYKLTPFFKTPEIAHKVRDLRFGVLNRSNKAYMDALPLEIANYPNIRVLDFGGVLLSDQAMIDHLATITRNKPILEVFVCDFNDSSLERWLSVIPDTSSLKQLCVSMCLHDINDKNSEQLFRFIAKQKNLKILDLNYYKNNTFKKGLLDYFNNAPKLSKLCLTDVELESDEWRAFGEGLSKQTELTAFAMMFSNLNDQSARYLKTVLQNNPQLTFLSLDNMDVSLSVTNDLLTSISSNKINYFIMNPCCNTENRATIFADFIKTQPSLTTAWITHCQMGDDDVIELIAARNGMLNPVTLQVGSERDQPNPSRESAVRILDGLRNKTLLSNGGKITINAAPFGLVPPHDPSQNYLIFSNDLGAWVEIYFNSLSELITINADDPKAIIPELTILPEVQSPSRYSFNPLKWVGLR